MPDPLVLSKGGNAAVTAFAGDHDRFRAVLSWRGAAQEVDLDIAALLLAPDGRVRDDDDLVFYNQPATADGSVRHVGKTAHDDGADDRLDVDLSLVPGHVTRVVIAASVDPGSGAAFGDVPDLVLRLLDADGDRVLEFPVRDTAAETAVVCGEFYRREDHWKFRAVGQGYASGLAGVAQDFGITITDAASDDGAPTEEAAVAPAAAGPVADDQAPVAPAPTDPLVADLAPVVAEELPPSPSSALLAAPAPRARPARVSTRKRAALTAPPPLLLAGNDSWQPARLFSISGIGAPDEQERRATSALMAVLMAVKPFGRALTGRFGAPAGTLEAYIEVGFPHLDTTVYPDAVIRVARGGRTWSCLLETKTGSNPLKREQVEAYLDVARAEGYDAVLTLSNELAPAAGTHPVVVDRRKTKKVALHHVAWSEVLHEARMQVQHHGIEDPTQAYLLRELVRYLEHPRSGASGFDDMGRSWVPAREAVLARTLRTGDQRALDVATSWDRLVRHLCLRLTGTLGVEVRQVLPRRLATDHELRRTEAVAQLVATGVLEATVRIPDAVAPLRVVADLRRGRVEVSVEVRAPEEGRPGTRVNWLVRQLKGAPDALRVECLVARRPESTCELLRDLRTSPAALVPDLTADVRGFRLTAESPLGTKRGVGKGAFITSVEQAVDAFYTDVVQVVRPWTAPPPRMPEVAEVALDVAPEVETAVEEESA